MDDLSPKFATHYQSSRGLMAIATMAYPHITNAIAKMEREGSDGQAEGVYAALLAQKAQMDADVKAAIDEAPEAEAVIGHNGGPELTPFEKVKAKLEDLRIEAGNFCDGAEIKSQAEADTVARLLRDVQAAANLAEAERIKEKEPHDTAAAEVQARYNTLIGNNKSIKGTAVVMEAALKTASTAWLLKLDAEQAKIRDEAAKVAREAMEAAQAHIAHTHDSTDLDDRESAIAEIDRAKELAFASAAANKLKAQAVVTGARSVSLRTVYDVEVTNAKDLSVWFWNNRKADLIAYMTDEVRKTVKAMSGNVTINGVKVLTQKVAS